MNGLRPPDPHCKPPAKQIFFTAPVTLPPALRDLRVIPTHSPSVFKRDFLFCFFGGTLEPETGNTFAHSRIFSADLIHIRALPQHPEHAWQCSRIFCENNNLPADYWYSHKCFFVYNTF